MIRRLRTAFAFMTVFPVSFPSKWDEKDLGRSAVFFPLAGLVIGGMAGFGGWLLSAVFPHSVSAVLTLIFWIFLSGGLHWDGLADCMDGFCYEGTQERRREIMKDSRMGTYGALGVICALLLKAVLIFETGQEEMPVLFALCGAAARWTMLFLVRLPSVNPNGMAAALLKGYSSWTLPLSLAFVLIPALFAGIQGIALFAAAVITAFLLGHLAKRKIGGVTGDVFGMTIEVTELVLLLVSQVMK